MFCIVKYANLLRELLALLVSLYNPRNLGNLRTEVSGSGLMRKPSLSIKLMPLVFCRMIEILFGKNKISSLLRTTQ
ncbi:MAG: hypothetical protein CVU11_13535 [Bacteroidetes bacterium HGW-Bacteroidetes-6]|nr:MAG: hypothetical protein CVU11_13535 [Bacteroidetes bacterium HGW-Bacteroidetes-6]